jgi:hypothetical protein
MMGENAETVAPLPGTDGTAASTRPRRLTRDQRDSLRTVSDSAVSGGYRDLVDKRYPWRPRRYYRVPRTAGALMVFGVLVAALGVDHPVRILFGLAVAGAAAVLGIGPNVLLWHNERRDKRMYDACLTLSFPATDLVNLAQEHDDLGVLIWRAQRADDGVRDSEAHEQELLTGVVALTTLTDAHYGLVAEIVELADERTLLAPALGRPALDDVVRPRLDAAAARLAAITASVEQLEAVHAEVALLDEHLADLRIAEQLLGHDSAMIPAVTTMASEPGGLTDAVAGIRSVREFVAAHRFGSGAP